MADVSNNVYIPSKFNAILNNFKTKNSIRQNNNVQTQNTNNGQDTVVINGEAKTGKLQDKKFIGKLCAAGAIILGAALALMQIKKGNLDIADKSFCHEKVFQDLPSLNELDEIAAQKIKNMTLDYGFSEDVATADKIKSAIKDLFYSHDRNIDKISKEAETDETLRHLLRILSGKNFIKEKADDAKKAMSPFYASGILSNYSSKQGTKDELESFMKLLISKAQDSDYQELEIANILSSYKGPYKNATRLTSMFDYANKKANAKGYGKLDIIKILRQNPDLRFYDAYNFMQSMEKGSFRLGHKGQITHLYDIRDILEDKNLDLKTFNACYKKLKGAAFENTYPSTLREIILDPDIDTRQAIDKLNALPEDVLKKFNSGDAITYLRFENFIGKSNINELTQAEKRELMNKLIKNNSNSFGNGNKMLPLIPKNQEEYCSLLNKLAKSIGIDTKPLTPEQMQAFTSGLKKLEHSIQDVDIDNLDISLTFSRQSFIEKAKEAMANLSEGEQRKVMDYFGFEISDGKLKGYPINANNGAKLAEIKDKKTKQVIESLRQTVIDFSENNPIKTNLADKTFEANLNEILKGLPELRPMIGKVQHHTHAYTLDKHTLKVLQGVVNNPKFKDLSEDDKQILTIASLLHDITKTEGIRDFAHPMESAFDAYYIIQKMNLPEEQQLKIYELIKSHNWLDRLNNPKNTADDIQRIAQDVAFDSRHTNTFELAKILCEADMKAVKKDSSFFEHHKKTLDEMSAIVDKYIKRIHETQIVLPQTVIPKASEIQNGVIKEANGIKNTVIYMNSAAEDLSQYGFSQGTTKDNWRGLVHALENSEQMQKFNTFDIIDTEALLSTSYIDTKSYKVFRKQGFILDVNPNDIHAGYSSDFGTGYGKSIELLKSDYLFNGQRKTKDVEINAWRSDRSKYRNYISGLIKQKLNISDEEYVSLMEKIQGCKSLTDIEEVDNNLAKALKEVFEEMESKKRRGGRQYNEMLVSRPKIQGVFAYDKPYEAIPEFLRKYAQDNDLPIIIFGNAK